jgi:predicted nucleotidyltransferase component of viral defense system
MAISLEEVRRRILIALFSDDELMNTLVLKGGNALALVYKVGSRASLDMDFSIQSAFSDVEKTGERIFEVLKREFGVIGYTLQYIDFIAAKTGNGLRLRNRCGTGIS